MNKNINRKGCKLIIYKIPDMDEYQSNEKPNQQNQF